MSDLNDRIAKAKGWTRVAASKEKPAQHWPDGFIWMFPHWLDVNGRPHGHVPDFTGTLEGVAGLMRELQQKQDRIDERNPYCSIDGRSVWSWRYLTHRKQYFCTCKNAITQTEYAGFTSPDDRPGDCVGEAYLTMKEAG